jgi:hypothetical protein
LEGAKNRLKDDADAVRKKLEIIRRLEKVKGFMEEMKGQL